jgi:S-DNA-T family DNA segregation ATPase FtsK/SpoIIIE
VAATAFDLSPNQLQVYVIDGSGALSDLAAWPVVGAVIEPADLDRAARLVRHLHETLAVRRRSDVSGPVVLFVVDAVESVMAAVDGSPDPTLRERLTRTILEGPAQGVVPVLSAVRPGAVPSSLLSSITERLYFRLADPLDYSLVGRSTRDLPDLSWGRGFDRDGHLIQIGRISDVSIREVAARAAGARRPPAIDVLPDRVPLDLLSAVAPGGSGEPFVPVGVGDRDLGPVGFYLNEGDHVLIAGPARSGRTTALMSIGSLAAAAGFEVVVLGRPDSPLRQLDVLVVDSPAELVAKAGGRRVLTLIDDAERVDHPAIIDLVRGEGPNVIAAGRADVLRGMYQHWTRDVRRCRLGLALRPQSDVDGELWQMQFPRRGPTFRQPGRGYLVSGGEVEVVQVAAP